MKNDNTSSENYLLGMDKDSLRRYRLFDEIYQPATEERFASLRLKPEMNILEVGCGIGLTACYMARDIAPEGKVVAFDQSEDLIEAAKQYAADAGINNVTFICAKAQEYDYEKEHFDLVHTRYVLTYSPFATEIMKKIYDALKPSGMFFGEEVYQAYVMHRQPKWFDNIIVWFASLIEIGGGNPNYGLDQMPSDMLDAGFGNLNITAYTPVKNQKPIVEMLRLAISHEMRKSLMEYKIADADEIDASVDEMTKHPKDSFISSSTVIQITGVKGE